MIEGRSFNLAEEFFLRASIVVISLAGLAYAVTTPLFEAPDEPAHFARAHGIAEGQLILKDSPRHLVVFVRETLKDRHNFEDVVSIMDQLLAEFPGRVPYIAPNTAMYSPVPYIFHALVIKVVTCFGESPFLLALSVYLCRLTSLFLFVCVLYLSFRMIPFAFWPLFWVAATPMAVSQAAVVSVDFVILGACVMLLAASLGDVKYPAFMWSVTTASFFVLMTKPPYAPLILVPAVSAVFAKSARRWQRTAIFAAILVILFLGAAAWNTLMVSQGFPNELRSLLWKYAHVRTDPTAQLAFITAHPVQFIHILWDNISVRGLSYFHQFVGVLGWLDLPIPFWTAALWGVLVVPAVLVSRITSLNYRTGLLLGITCLVVTVLLVVSISASVYMVWMPVGIDWINVQGRYFHPVAAVFLVGLTLIIPFKTDRRSSQVLQSSLLLAASMIHGMSVYTVLSAY
jgi:uncharacterized membrane protein